MVMLHFLDCCGDWYLKCLFSKCMSMIIVSHSLRIRRKIIKGKTYNSSIGNLMRYLICFDQRIKYTTILVSIMEDFWVFPKLMKCSIRS